jgi:hypothetical protein
MVEVPRKIRIVPLNIEVIGEHAGGVHERGDPGDMPRGTAKGTFWVASLDGRDGDDLDAKVGVGGDGEGDECGYHPVAGDGGVVLEAFADVCRRVLSAKPRSKGRLTYKHLAICQPVSLRQRQLAVKYRVQPSRRTKMVDNTHSAECHKHQDHLDHAGKGLDIPIPQDSETIDRSEDDRRTHNKHKLPSNLRPVPKRRQIRRRNNQRREADTVRISIPRQQAPFPYPPWPTYAYATPTTTPPSRSTNTLTNSTIALEMGQCVTISASPSITQITKNPTTM